MKYIYGPVKSRRLGLSLGITLTPYKICNFNCIYCQLGLTTITASKRKEYIKIEDIFSELKTWLKNNSADAKKLNYITISGTGEPTLNIKIGQLIKKIKKITATPVAVITNASLLGLAAVKKALLQADLIVPSLDAVLNHIFKKIDRPRKTLKIEKIINGLISLRKKFKGKLWLEVMLVRGINEEMKHIRKLKEIINKINPDKIQLNSPVRTTAEPNVFALEHPELEKIKHFLGEKAEII